MGALRDGTITAIESEFVLDQGAYIYMIKRMLTHMCCRSDAMYRVPNLRHDAIAVYTHKCAQRHLPQLRRHGDDLGPRADPGPPGREAGPEPPGRCA